ncbi:MAG: hypothetical protein ACFUZC_14895 [Chthoniobacteraceae bacterium]
MRMIVSAVYCPNCHLLIFSRAHHDFRRCPCSSFGVDGGPGLERVEYRDEFPRVATFSLPVPRERLLDDYADDTCAFGYLTAVEISDTGIVRLRLGGRTLYFRLHPPE